MKNLHVADADNPEDIVMASQKALLDSMERFLYDTKKDIGGPGLTWDQIDVVFSEFRKLKPRIVKQRFMV